MSANTVNALADDGYFLYSFKPVQSASKAGRPLVWSKTSSYSMSTIVSWSQQYNAYTSQSTIAPGEPIYVGFSAVILPGQTLQVGSNGIGDVINQGPAGQISIYNTSATQLACGVAQAQSGAAAAPYCVFPLYGQNQESLTPVDGILLMFSTSEVAVGTVIETSLNDASATTVLLADGVLFAISPGISIDLAGAASVSVAYDINLGWSWASGVIAQLVPANADLVSYLILPPS